MTLTEVASGVALAGMATGVALVMRTPERIHALKRFVLRARTDMHVAPGEPSLVALSPEVGAGRWSISAVPLIVGRDTAMCGAVIEASLTPISRQHCAVWWDSNARAYRVRDEGSANGTFVESGKPCDAPDGTLVAPGSVIYLGRKSLRFLLAPVSL